MTDVERQKKIDKQLVGLYNFSPAAKEPHFSKALCECCKSMLAGERHEFTATVGKAHYNERITIGCCVDCYLYLFS